MVKMTIMTMMIMMDRGLCRAGLNFPARDRLKWVRGGLMPHPDAIPRSSSSSEWPSKAVYLFYILYFFSVFVFVRPFNSVWDQRSNNGFSLYFTLAAWAWAPPCSYKTSAVPSHLDDDDGADGLAAMIASVFKYLRAIRCLRFVCCSIICLEINLVCRALSPLTGCSLDDQDTNQV